VLSFHEAKAKGMSSPNFNLDLNLSSGDARGLEVEELMLILAEGRSGVGSGGDGEDGGGGDGGTARFDEARAELVRRQMERAGIDPETGLPPGVDPHTGLVVHSVA